MPELHTTLSNENAVIIFADEKPFGFDDIGQREPNGTTTAANLDRRYPSIRGTASCSFTIMPLSVH